MTHTLRQTLVTLAILMVACSQVFGLQRGFVCDCGGHEHITQLDHCHGFVPSDEHDHDDHDDDHEEEPWHDSSQHEDEDTHGHPANVESLTAELASTIHAATPDLVFIALVSYAWLELEQLALKAPAQDPLPPWHEHDPGQRWPHVLAHTVSLRI